MNGREAIVGPISLVYDRITGDLRISVLGKATAGEADQGRIEQWLESNLGDLGPMFLGQSVRRRKDHRGDAFDRVVAMVERRLRLALQYGHMRNDERGLWHWTG